MWEWEGGRGDSRKRVGIKDCALFILEFREEKVAKRIAKDLFLLINEVFEFWAAF